MSRLVFLLGGARSGKSTHALRLAEAAGQPVTFIATAQALDAEMSARIARHRAERPAAWTTLEIPFGVAARAGGIGDGVVVLDCVTMLVSNRMMPFVRGEELDEAAAMEAVDEEVGALIGAVRSRDWEWIVTSNEVGLGVVPPYPLGRAYRDLLGWANQRLAREADEVLWMVAGIPVPIQGFRRG